MKLKISKKALIYPLFILFIASPVSSQSMEDVENSTLSPTKPPRERRVVEREIKERIREDKMLSPQASASPKLNKKNYEERSNVISDEKKQEAVARIESKLTDRNSRMTEIMNTHLQKLSEVVERISEKASANSVSENNTGLITAISKAETAIEAAEKSILAQSNNTYSIEITEESKVKVNASEAVKNFKSDMQRARQQVKLAHEAVLNVVKSYKALMQEYTEDVNSTKSAEVNL
jgi:hypothetical protein